MSRRRMSFYGFTVAVLAILLILPTTGWLARLQLMPFWDRPRYLPLLIGKDDTSFAESGADSEQIERAVAAAPNDFEIQFANAMNGANTAEDIQRLEALDRKFPHNPLIVATLLRLMSSEQVTFPPVHSEYWLYGGLWRGTWHYRPSAPERVSRFLALAKEGEELEPNNAYFTMMRAAGNMAAGRSAAGIADWVRAGERTEWDDYATAETLAAWKLNEKAKGTELGFTVRESFLLVPVYGHLPRIRMMGSAIAVAAVQAELAGDRQNGLRLRRANRRNGQNMMSHSKGHVGTWVGRNLVRLSAVRPGGAPPTESFDEELTSANACVKDRITAYRSYLRKNFPVEEATAFDKAVAQGDKLVALDDDKEYIGCFGLGKKTTQIMGFVGLGSLLMTTALFGLMFGAIFKLAYRFSPRLRRGKPLQASARWGVCLGLLLPALALAVDRGIAVGWCDATELLWAGFTIGGLLVIVPPVLLRLSARQIGHGVLLILATIAALGGMVTTGRVALAMIVGELKQLGYFAMTIASGYGNEDGLAAAVIAVPLLMLCVFGILSRILRVPVAAGVTRGMRATAIPLAALLMLHWAGTLLYTLRLDHLATAQLRRMEIVGETRTIAEAQHRRL